jgi:hypothetical protein
MADPVAKLQTFFSESKPVFSKKVIAERLEYFLLIYNIFCGLAGMKLTSSGISTGKCNLPLDAVFSKCWCRCRCRLAAPQAELLC